MLAELWSHLTMLGSTIEPITQGRPPCWGWLVDRRRLLRPRCVALAGSQSGVPVYVLWLWGWVGVSMNVRACVRGCVRWNASIEIESAKKGALNPLESISLYGLPCPPSPSPCPLSVILGPKPCGAHVRARN